MQEQTIQQWRAWSDAVQRDGVDRAIRSLYAEIGRVVAERRPVCNASGRCCKFEEYGHRLYVTGLEIAWFMQGVGNGEPGVGQTRMDGRQIAIPLQQLAASLTTPNCPYQVNGLCSTHAIRPLGCRVFFCEEGTEAWQQDTTEAFLERFKQLHVEHGLPYQYMEWRAGLSEAAQALGV